MSRKLKWGWLVLGLAWNVWASEMPETLFIVDASGSMAAVGGGRTKMEEAKGVLAQVVAGLPEDVRIGLAAYGHRRPRDCEDIEILVSPGSRDRADFLARVAALEPRGMTPIAASILQVADALGGRDVETTIVMVSDGQETCGGDPCAVVKELKKTGIRFVLHVVGFDVTAADKEQLSCIAEAGGGRYFGAEDATGLLESMQEVSREIEQKVEAAKTVVVARSTGLGKARMAFPESALTSMAGFAIRRAADGQIVKEAEFPSADSMHPLMSGEYDLTLKFANPNYKPPTEMPAGSFTVVRGETAEVVLGALVFNVAEELRQLPIEAVVVTRTEPTGEPLRIDRHDNDYYLLRPKALPPGTYQVDMAYSRSEELAPIAVGVEIEAGKETVLTLDSGLQLRKPAGTKITAWELRNVETGGVVLSVRRGWDNEEPLWRMFPVPPGRYELWVWVEGMEEALPAAEDLDIPSGQSIRFDTGL